MWSSEFPSLGEPFKFHYNIGGNTDVKGDGISTRSQNKFSVICDSLRRLQSEEKGK